MRIAQCCPLTPDRTPAQGAAYLGKLGPRRPEDTSSMQTEFWRTAAVTVSVNCPVANRRHGSMSSRYTSRRNGAVSSSEGASRQAETSDSSRGSTCNTGTPSTPARAPPARRRLQTAAEGPPVTPVHRQLQRAPPARRRHQKIGEYIQA